jgi:hypothetical protein
MALKRKGILARPGKYKYGDKEEIKTAEELKRAAERQPIIALTLGHPEGYPRLQTSSGPSIRSGTSRNNALTQSSGSTTRYPMK